MKRDLTIGTTGTTVELEGDAPFLGPFDDLPTLASFWTDTLANLQSGKPVSPDDGKTLWMILAGINEPAGQKLIKAIHEHLRRDRLARVAATEARLELLNPSPDKGLSKDLESFERKQRRAKKLIADKNPKG